MANSIIQKLLITEKSTRLNEIGQYIFRVDKRANKSEIKKIVSKLYGVHVERVQMVNIPPKPRRYRGQTRHTSGYQKAIVTLKKGEVINV